ncbi:hypothetical protein K502DRAFT_362061 [Neoconidiobolus thromboides FSU 785]|nr:hypothetical protein K502DRAFT_362061 [Neoconidiobolus thromboides FSU 785]
MGAETDIPLSDLYALNLVSLIAASSVLALFVIARILKPNLVKRVTLRLQTGSAATDFILHIINIYDDDSAQCTTLGFFRYFTRLAYCFINISIAINLQLIFIHEKEPNNSWEIIYWSASLFLAIVLNIPQIFLGYYVQDKGNCVLRSSTPDEKAFGIINSSIMIATFLYCLVVSIFVLFRLRKDWTSLVKSTFNQMNQSRKRMRWLQRELKGLALRVVLYPIVTFVVLSGFSIYQISFAFVDSKTLLSNWSNIGQNLSGLLDFLAICFDPSLQFCYKTIFKELYQKIQSRSKSTVIPHTIEVEEPNPSQQIVDPEVNYFSDCEYTMHSESSSDGSYQCIMFDDDQCRQAVNLF